MELTGDQIREFAELQSKNPHFSAAQLTELRNAKTIAGAVKPDKTHGKLVGVMLGRYWYAS